VINGAMDAAVLQLLMNASYIAATSVMTGVSYVGLNYVASRCDNEAVNVQNSDWR